MKQRPNKINTKAIAKKPDNTANYLLLFFLSSFLLKTVFGAISDSKFLLVSGVFALIGVIVSAELVLRRKASNRSEDAPPDKYLTHEKIGFIVIAATSLVIAVLTGLLLFSIIHLAFFHRIKLPGFTALVIAALLAAVNSHMISWFKAKAKAKAKAIGDIEVYKIVFLLYNEFVFSILVVITVIFGRLGWSSFDYALAILAVLYIFIFSVYSLNRSFKILMHASHDLVEVAKISNAIKRADPALRIKELKVSRPDKMVEIIAILYLSKSTSVKDAAKIISKIKYVLYQTMSVPFEVHIGFTAK